MITLRKRLVNQVSRRECSEWGRDSIPLSLIQAVQREETWGPGGEGLAVMWTLIAVLLSGIILKPELYKGDRRACMPTMRGAPHLHHSPSGLCPACGLCKLAPPTLAPSIFPTGPGLSPDPSQALLQSLQGVYEERWVREGRV